MTKSHYTLNESKLDENYGASSTNSLIPLNFQNHQQILSPSGSYSYAHVSESRIKSGSSTNLASKMVRKLGKVITFNANVLHQPQPSSYCHHQPPVKSGRSVPFNKFNKWTSEEKSIDPLPPLIPRSPTITSFFGDDYSDFGQPLPDPVIQPHFNVNNKNNKSSTIDYHKSSSNVYLERQEQFLDTLYDQINDLDLDLRRKQKHFRNLIQQRDRIIDKQSAVICKLLEYKIDDRGLFMSTAPVKCDQLRDENDEKVSLSEFISGHSRSKIEGTDIDHKQLLITLQQRKVSTVFQSTGRPSKLKRSTVRSGLNFTRQPMRAVTNSQNNANSQTIYQSMNDLSEVNGSRRPEMDDSTDDVSGQIGGSVGDDNDSAINSESSQSRASTNSSFFDEKYNSLGKNNMSSTVTLSSSFSSVGSPSRVSDDSSTSDTNHPNAQSLLQYESSSSNVACLVNMAQPFQNDGPHIFTCLVSNDDEIEKAADNTQHIISVSEKSTSSCKVDNDCSNDNNNKLMKKLLIRIDDDESELESVHNYNQ